MNKHISKNIVEKKNISFFNNNEVYKKNIEDIDTYQILKKAITEKLLNTKYLLDIGHGGSFDYDTNIIQNIVGLDLEEMIDKEKLPKNIKLVKGSALDIPTNLINFDTTLLIMLLHHLVGKNVTENLHNLDKCISETYKTLKENGKIVIVESCVPKWFFLLEKILYKPSKYFIEKFIEHPPAFQFTKKIIVNCLKKNNFKNLEVTNVKQGKFILQFGIKFPTFLTPVETVIFTAEK